MLPQRPAHRDASQAPQGGLLSGQRARPWPPRWAAMLWQLCAFCSQAPAGAWNGVPVSMPQAFSTGSLGASTDVTRRCVASLCTGLTSRWIASSSDSGKGKVCRGDFNLADPMAHKNASRSKYGPKTVHPDIYFINNPIIVNLGNEFVTKGKGRSKHKVPDEICGSFQSLVDVVVEHHLDEQALLHALDEGNLLVNTETVKFVLKEVKTCHKLTPARERIDFQKLHNIIVGFIERRHGEGSTSLLPEDFCDFLDKLLAECVNVKLILLHPIFLSWLDRILFWTLADICVRMSQNKKPANNAEKNLKEALSKVISELPYLIPGVETLDLIVSNNKILKFSNTCRENEKKRWKKVNMLAAKRKIAKETRKKRKGGSQAAAARVTKKCKEGTQAAATGATGKSKGGTQAATAILGAPKKAQEDQLLVNKGCRMISLNRDGFNHLVQIAAAIGKIVYDMCY